MCMDFFFVQLEANSIVFNSDNVVLNVGAPWLHINIQLCLPKSTQMIVEVKVKLLT